MVLVAFVVLEAHAHVKRLKVKTMKFLVLSMLQEDTSENRWNNGTILRRT